MSFLQITMLLSMAACGLGAALVGTIKVPLAARLKIDEARIGGLVSVFGFTLVPIILSAGFLTDLAGPRVVLVSGSLLLGMSLGLLAVARNYVAALAAVMVLSGGWALVINVNNVLLRPAFSGRLAYATNLANVFFGLGAFLTPLATGLLLRRISFMPALVVLGCLCLVPGVLALEVDFAALASAAAPENLPIADPGGVFRDPFAWLCGLMLLFYGPLEASLGAWTTTYLSEQGCRERSAAVLLSAFWLTFMGARLLTAFFLPANGEPPLILALSLACVAVLGGMVLGRGPVAGAAAVIASGAIFGPLFPTLMAVYLEHFHPAVRGRAVGMLFAIGGIGWAVIPLLIGAAARRWGVRRGFGVAIGAAVGLSITAVVLFVRYGGASLSQ